MAAVGLDADLIGRICGATVGVSSVHDVLDGSIWVSMPTRALAGQALKDLNDFGLGGHDFDDGRLHVTGWDRRLLHWRLGRLLAGVDDLQAGWDSTAELVCYHCDRRIAASVEPDLVDILADVEAVIRSCVPIPHQATQTDDVAVLLELISSATDAWERLVAEHIEYAEEVLAAYLAHEYPGAA